MNRALKSSAAKVSAAAFGAVALAAATARGQVYSFETLYDTTNQPDPSGSYPDDFQPNPANSPKGSLTDNQSTVGVTNGSYSMEVQVNSAGDFEGVLTTVIPEAINDPGTTALSVDVTIPGNEPFNGNFARMGITEFGTNASQGYTTPIGVQTTLAEEVNINDAPGTYHLTIPLIAYDNPVTGQAPDTFSDCFGSDQNSQLEPVSFEFYFNKSTTAPLTVYLDNVEAVGLQTTGTWSHSSGGSWSTSSDWAGGIPEVALDTAYFNNAIGAPSTVTLDGNRSVGALNFSSPQAYLIAPGSGGTLTLDAGGSNTSTVTDSSGSQTISAPVALNTDTVITVNNTGDLLNISGNISGNISFSNPQTTAHLSAITLAGKGTLELSGVNSYISGTSVNSGTLLIGNAQALPAANSSVTIANGATLKFAPSIGGVQMIMPTIASGGTFDIGNDHAFINYAAGSDPIASIQALLASGYNGGSWTGTGITSSAAAATAGSYGIGYADSADPGNPASLGSNQIELKYTLLGDANLDGKVNGTDFAILASNFNQAVTSWDQGDFNYDGKVNGTDFAFLASNFNQGASLADVAALQAFAAAHGLSLSVPEPASGALVMAAWAVGTMRRRRRSSHPA